MLRGRPPSRQRVCRPPKWFLVCSNKNLPPFSGSFRVQTSTAGSEETNTLVATKRRMFDLNLFLDLEGGKDVR